MNRLFRALIILSVVLFIGAGVASADTLEFTLDKGVVPVAVFDLAVDLHHVLTTPFTFGAGVGFVVTPTWKTPAFSGDFLGFFNPSTTDGGVAIFASGTNMVLYASGPQIYGGITEARPTFVPGMFTLNDGSVVPPAPGVYTLTIRDLSVVGAPEPSVTILLAIGLLALGLTVVRYKPSFGVSAS